MTQASKQACCESVADDVMATVESPDREVDEFLLEQKKVGLFLTGAPARPTLLANETGDGSAYQTVRGEPTQ